MLSVSDCLDSLTTALISLSRLAEDLNSSNFCWPQTRGAECCHVIAYSQGGPAHTARASLSLAHKTFNYFFFFQQKQTTNFDKKLHLQLQLYLSLTMPQFCQSHKRFGTHIHYSFILIINLKNTTTYRNTLQEILCHSEATFPWTEPKMCIFFFFIELVISYDGEYYCITKPLWIYWS